MRMNLARKGLVPQIIKPEFDEVSDRSTVEWKTNDLKALGVTAGDVSLTYQVYIRGALTAAEVSTLLEDFNKEDGQEPAPHQQEAVKELVLPMESIGEFLDETRQLVLLLGSLTEKYRMLATILDSTPNVTLAYTIQALSGIEASDESSSTQETAFAAKLNDFSNKRRFSGKCFYCKKTRHKEFECRKKKFDEGHRQVAQAHASDFAFTAARSMTKSEWLVDSGHITIADGTTINAFATGTVGLKLMDGTSVTLSDVLYTPEVEGSLISVFKLTEKDVVAQFIKGKYVFRYGDAAVIEAKRCGNVHKLKEPWAVVQAHLGHIPYKRYEQLLPKAEGVLHVTDGVNGDDVCAGCCIRKLRADNFPRYQENLVKSAGVLDLEHTDVMGPTQTKTPRSCTYVAKSNVLSTFKIYKAAMDNATDEKIKRLRSENGGEHTGRPFMEYLNRSGIKHEKPVPYTPQ
ncbi:hypothetical protein PC113_g16879 [Phytophthora cactorum]|uniref:Retrovirus-related Pol polyprotein from transposon TNT 1-94-like beta-barrel domain-containing protein n=1 Tax=Phytophthora cactorum TaxID=29920 RepID=A0A8T0YMJ7_9STRA|nr:hypothetical protein PC113_g16879 [Phytophthora cactorum]